MTACETGICILGEPLTQWISIFIGISTLFLLAFNIDILRDTFKSAHPPKIGVYQIKSDFKAEKYSLNMIIVNEGGTDAYLSPRKNHHSYVALSNKIPKYFPSEGDMLKCIRILRAGEAYEWKLNPGYIENFLNEIDMNGDIYLIGIIRFIDERKVLHRTLFCRIYNKEKDSWKIVEDTDFEYRT